MPTDWLIRNLFVSLFLPPANVVALGLLALVVWRRWPRVSYGLVVLAIGGLWLQAAPRVAEQVVRGLWVGAPLNPAALERAFAPQGTPHNDTLPQAIVVLGGGMEQGANEYGAPGGANLNRASLARVRYGAFVARRTHLPLLVSGGSPSGFSTTEALWMQQALEQEYGLPVCWVEAQSLNTLENAQFSARMLKRSGVTRIYLITDYWHMRRAVAHFQREGLTVVPAPCGTGGVLEADGVLGFWPTLTGLMQMRSALREWMAIAVGH